MFDRTRLKMFRNDVQSATGRLRMIEAALPLPRARCHCLVFAAIASGPDDTVGSDTASVRTAVICISSLNRQHSVC